MEFGVGELRQRVVECGVGLFRTVVRDEDALHTRRMGRRRDKTRRRLRDRGSGAANATDRTAPDRDTPSAAVLLVFHEAVIEADELDGL
ncbi:hypothetical protein GCM10028857_17490 [Salinarchaeum chitinilyticum]